MPNQCVLFLGNFLSETDYIVDLQIVKPKF